MPAPRKLPTPRRLRQEYLAGGTLTTLATRYGVTRKGVYDALQRDAKRDGVSWPLKQGRPGWERRKATAVRTNGQDAVTSVMICAEIHEVRETYRVTVLELADLAGINPSTLWKVIRGDRKFVARRTARKIQTAIEKIEAGAPLTRQYQPRRKTA